MTKIIFKDGTDISIKLKDKEYNKLIEVLDMELTGFFTLDGKALFEIRGTNKTVTIKLSEVIGVEREW